MTSPVLGGQEPPQEAVDWLAKQMSGTVMATDGQLRLLSSSERAARALTALRDALAKGGPDAEQVATALGLTVETRASQGNYVSVTTGPAGGELKTFRYAEQARLVGPWVEVTP